MNFLKDFYKSNIISKWKHLKQDIYFIKIELYDSQINIHTKWTYWLYTCIKLEYNFI